MKPVIATAHNCVRTGRPEGMEVNEVGVGVNLVHVSAEGPLPAKSGHSASIVIVKYCFFYLSYF